MTYRTSGLEANEIGAQSVWRGRRLELVGAALVASLAMWVLVVAGQRGGEPWPVVAVAAGSGVTLLVSHRVSRHVGILVPAVVVGLILGLAAMYGRDAVANADGPLGYSNATSSLYVLGVGAAGLGLLRVRRPASRLLFVIPALLLAVLPWPADVIGARVTGGVVVLALVAVAAARPPLPRAVFPACACLVLLAVAATTAAGVLYQGDGEGDAAGALSERRLILWREAAEMLRAQPVLGVGPGRFGMFSETAQLDDNARWAHNEPLQLAAETGLPGLVLLLALVIWTFVWLAAAGTTRETALGAVVLSTALVHACVDYLWHFPAVPLALAAVVGAATATEAKRSVAQARP